MNQFQRNYNAALNVIYHCIYRNSVYWGPPKGLLSPCSLSNLRFSHQRYTKNINPETITKLRKIYPGLQLQLPPKTTPVDSPLKLGTTCRPQPIHSCRSTTNTPSPACCSVRSGGRNSKCKAGTFLPQERSCACRRCIFLCQEYIKSNCWPDKAGIVPKEHKSLDRMKNKLVCYQIHKPGSYWLHKSGTAGQLRTIPQGI